MIPDSIRRFATVVLLSATAQAICAAPIDDAKKLYNSGRYEEATEQLRAIVKRSPRDGTANYYLGASLYATGNKTEATDYLNTAESRGVNEASRLLAEIALADYRVDNAQSHLETWAANLKKAKKSLPDTYPALATRIVNLRNMLDRVERIEIIDSLSVDSAFFFKTYKLSANAGKILPPDAVRSLGTGTSGDIQSSAFMPENGTEIFWAETDSAGYLSLFGADILDDGTVDRPMPLHRADGPLTDAGINAAYPFLMADGMTLYFAATGDNSIGGYDIFMTRRNEDGTFYQPQNVGMPYNSPANDYLLAIDETCSLGWWATDRNSEPGKITIYIFSPNQMRVNVEPGDPNLQSLAKADNIALTRKSGTDYADMLTCRLDEAENSTEKTVSARFAIDLGRGKVYTTLNDFKNPAARSAMLEALGAEVQLRNHLADEESLRTRYRKGDRSCASEIKASEDKTAKLRRQLVTLRNKAIRLENN